LAANYFQSISTQFDNLYAENLG